MTRQEQANLQDYILEANKLSTKVLAYKRSINQISLYRLGVFLIGVAGIYLVGTYVFIYMLLVFFVNQFCFYAIGNETG